MARRGDRPARPGQSLHGPGRTAAAIRSAAGARLPDGGPRELPALPARGPPCGHPRAETSPAVDLAGRDRIGHRPRRGPCRVIRLPHRSGRVRRARREPGGVTGGRGPDQQPGPFRCRVAEPGRFVKPDPEPGGKPVALAVVACVSGSDAGPDAAAHAESDRGAHERSACAPDPVSELAGLLDLHNSGRRQPPQHRPLVRGVVLADAGDEPRPSDPDPCR